MPDYAVIYNNEVVNAIVADSEEVAKLVTDLEILEVTDYQPWIGWKRIDGVWVNPNEETPEVTE